MKNNLISYIKNGKNAAKVLAIIILCSGNFVFGRDMGRRASQAPRSPSTAPAQTSPSVTRPTSSTSASQQPTLQPTSVVPQIIIQQPFVPATAPAATTVQSAQTTSQSGQGISDVDMRTMVSFSYPWNNDQYNWIQQMWPYMTSEQRDYINQDYNAKRLRRGTTTPYLSTRTETIGEEEEKAAEESSWSAEKALTGTKERIGSALGWGWQKGKEAYKYAASIPGSVWGYKSSLGTGTKAAIGATTTAVAPYIVGASALGAPGLAAGAAAYGVTTLLDRLEFRYQSGHWSESTAASFENLRLQEALDDSLAYPTISVKIEALGDPLELVTDTQREGDKFDISKKARVKLRQMFQKKLQGSNENTKEFDATVNRHIYDIRSAGGYNPEIFNQLQTHDDKMAALQNYMNWLQSAYNIPLFEAVLSEYMRALKKSDELDIQQKKQKKSEG